MNKTNKDYDLICVGGGIMSATLALILKLCDPKLKILIFERLLLLPRKALKPGIMRVLAILHFVN